MEREQDKTGILLQSDDNKGAVLVAEDVVAMIASLAATEVDGVCGMTGTITNELMSKVGMKNLTKGVKVTVLGGEVKALLTLQMEYGYNIPATCQLVQNKVKTTIENMTGLVCSEINVRIAGINVRK